jgi:lipopolysaccharide/colanic/teichoic acid biosynthesis glycosyltransferase
MMPEQPRRAARGGHYQRFGKRALDLCVAIPAGLFALPLGLLLAAAVRLGLGTPVLFTQRRPGLHGEIFVVRKFRTMTDARDETGRFLPDEGRLTPFGRFLRRSSLDELPEIWNVIRGEMSLVGPRPLLPRYLARYTPRQATRHDVRPGLTGWALVNGRNAVDWEEKLNLDVWYVENLSLGLDLRILARTAVVALTGRGVSAAGHATMPEFLGTEPGAGEAPGGAIPDETEES